MANLGTRSVTLLKDYPPHLREGETVEAECWLNLDAYADCATVHLPDGKWVGLGRMEYGGWKYAEPKVKPCTCGAEQDGYPLHAIGCPARYPE